MPAFSGRIIEDFLGSWKWGVLDKDKKMIKDHLAALQILKERGVKGSGIIDTYHKMRVAPLMSHMLPLYLMVPGALLERMTLVEEAGREARAEHADGVHRHSSAQQQGKRLPVDAPVDLQQGVAFAVVLRQG